MTCVSGSPGPHAIPIQILPRYAAPHILMIKKKTLDEYLLVAQDKPHIEQFRRQPNGQWLLSATAGMESFIDLSSVGCRISLAEIYDKVEFASEPGEPRHNPKTHP